MAMTLIIFILYGLAAHSVSRQIASAPQGLVWLQRSFAATFAALGVKPCHDRPIGSIVTNTFAT